MPDLQMRCFKRQLLHMQYAINKWDITNTDHFTEAAVYATQAIKADLIKHII